MKSYIHLIRHGITEGNQKGWYYGESDLPLANEGVDRLVELAKEGTYPDHEKADYYTTGLLRTEQTFFLIYGNKEHQQLPELQEFSFGVFEKKTHEELEAYDEYTRWISDKSGQLAPENGESIAGFNGRISGGFKKLIGLHRLKELSVRHSGDDAVSIVVCHGGVISAIMTECFPGEDRNNWQWIPDPGHGYSLCLEEGIVKSYHEF